MSNRTLINPRTVMVAIPCHDGKIMSELNGSLVMNANRYCAISLQAECSHVSLVRNRIADYFLLSPFEWLVQIDSDIYPRPEDWELLLECTDREASYVMPDGSLESDSLGAPRKPGETMPCPSRIDTITAFGTRTMADILVASEYAYKREPFKPVKLGLGFVRVHRSVFALLQNLKHEPGETVEVSRDLIEQIRGIRSEQQALPAVQTASEEIEKAVGKSIALTYKESALVGQLLESVQDKTGSPRLWQCHEQGRSFYDYYPSGPIINTLMPTSAWMGEDHGFFTLCMLAGIVVRRETRTRLIHIGRKAYPYLSPEEERQMREAWKGEAPETIGSYAPNGDSEPEQMSTREAALQIAAAQETLSTEESERKDVPRDEWE